MSRYLVLDVETPNRRNDRICAISAIQIVDWVIADRFFMLVNPETYFEQFCIDLHGITENAVRGSGTFPDVWRVIRDRFEGSTIVAHNAPFDIRVIESCCAAYGLPFKRPRYIDTVQIARAALPQLAHHRLNDVCEAWGIALDHHNAESDCTACAEIFLRCAMDGMNVSGYEKLYKASERGQWTGQRNTASSRTFVPFPPSAAPSTAQPHRELRDTMPLWVKIMLTVAVILGLLRSCASAPTTRRTSEPPNAIASQAEEETKEYLTKVQWSDLKNYKCAVEVDEYSGDVLAAGTYNFYPSATDGLFKKDVPIVWDIYVSKHNYDSLSDLSERSHVATVGGLGNTSAQIKLKKGRYLYVKYNKTVGNPIGILNIEKAED